MTGDNICMAKMPSPGEAERNQRRKLEFIPVWPVVGAFVVAIALVFILHYT